jgi:hypothetical protein
MTVAPQVEYVGFKTDGTMREYTLLLRRTGDDSVGFVIVIPNEAFLAHRVRYQDAPEICFLKLHREILACAEGLPSARLIVSDADLLEYRAAHTPKPARRRPRPPTPS